MGTRYIIGFFYTMILNTKKSKLTDDKIMRSANGLYLVAIYPLVRIPVYPSPPSHTHTHLYRFS